MIVCFIHLEAALWNYNWKKSTESICALSAKAFRLKAAPGNTFLKAHIDRLSSEHGYTDYMAL